MAPTLRIPNPFQELNGFHGNDTIAVAMMFSCCKKAIAKSPEK
jgi:hypothetical protein